MSPQAKKAKTEDVEETFNQYDEDVESDFDREDIDSGEDDDDQSTMRMKVSEEDSSESSTESSELFSPISPPNLPTNFQPRVFRSAKRPLHQLVRHSCFLLDVLEAYSFECSRDNFNKQAEQDPSKKRQYKERADAYDKISAQADRALSICDKVIASHLK